MTDTDTYADINDIITKITQLDIKPTVPTELTEPSVPTSIVKPKKKIKLKLKVKSAKPSNPEPNLSIKTMIDQVFESSSKMIKDSATQTKPNESNTWKALGLNPLQPNKYDCLALESTSMLCSTIKSMTLSQWYKSFPLEQLFSRNKIGIRQKMDDQYSRAKIIVGMLKPTHKEIITMDGHGRFIRCLAEVLYQEKPELASNITITVVDNFVDNDKKQIVTEWHKLFFPSCVKSVQGNIYDYKPTDTSLVYLNFCGIGGKPGIKSFIKYISSIQTVQSVLLSFSTARKAGETEAMIMDPGGYSLVGSEYVKNYQLDKKTTRTIFPTFIVNVNSVGN